MKWTFCTLLVVLLLVGMTLPAFAVDYMPDLLSGYDTSFANAVNKLGSLYSTYKYHAAFAYVYGVNTQYHFVFVSAPVFGKGSYYYTVFVNPSGVATLYGPYTCSDIVRGSNVFLIKESTNKRTISVTHYVKDLSTADFITTGYESIFDDYTAYEWILYIGSPPPSPIDKTSLQSLIETAIQINNDNYTSASWSNFQSKLASAQLVNDDTAATQDQVDAALNALQASIDGLEHVPTVNTSLLDEKLTYVDTLNESQYTPQSWQKLQFAIVTARSILNNPNATQSQIDSSLYNLQIAINGLQSSGTTSSIPDIPEGHRYLVDGVLPSDLIPAQEAIFQNIKWGKGAGVWAFSLLIVVYVALKVIRSIFGIQGENRYIDINQPGFSSSFINDNGNIRKERKHDYLSDKGKYHSKYD